MKLKKIVVLGVSCALISCTMAQAEAGFSWGGIANKVANKAADSILSGGSKKSTDSSASKKSSQTMTKEERADAAAAKQGVKITRTKIDGSKPTAFYGELDPLPPDAFEDRPAWFDNRTNPYVMTNARLVAEYENIEKWRAYADKNGIGWVEPDMVRHDELIDEIRHRVRAIGSYQANVNAGWMDMASGNAQKETYQRAVASNIDPLRKYGLELKISTAQLLYYHPERN